MKNFIKDHFKFVFTIVWFTLMAFMFFEHIDHQISCVQSECDWIYKMGNIHNQSMYDQIRSLEMQLKHAKVIPLERGDLSINDILRANGQPVLK